MVPEVRDWPVWEWTAWIVAGFASVGVLGFVGDWVKVHLGAIWLFVLFALLGAAGLGLFLRDRPRPRAPVGPPADGEEDGEAPVEERERRAKLGFLVALLLVYGALFLVEGTFGDLLETLRSFPASNWPSIAVLLAHVAVLARAFVVSLTERWPLHTGPSPAAGPPGNPAMRIKNPEVCPLVNHP